MLRTCVPISCTHVRSDLPETLPYSRSPSESPLHFADRRAESVVVGVITLPQKCLLLAADSRVRLRESFLCGESTSPTGDVSRDSKGGAAPLAHDFGTKSSVLHLDRGVKNPQYAKSPMPNTLTVRTWDLMLPRPSRVLVTNPNRQLPCYFSKTVLRTPSYCPQGLFVSAAFLTGGSMLYL